VLIPVEAHVTMKLEMYLGFKSMVRKKIKNKYKDAVMDNKAIPQYIYRDSSYSRFF